MGTDDSRIAVPDRATGECRVFVSYARADEALVRPIVSVIRAVGASVFFDLDSLAYGKPWRPILENSLSEASTVLVFWCQHSATSDEVRREWEQATQLSKDVVPILVDDQPLARELARYQGVDLRPLVRASHSKVASKADKGLLTTTVLDHAQVFDIEQSLAIVRQILSFIAKRATDPRQHGRERRHAARTAGATSLIPQYRVLEQMKRMRSVAAALGELSLVEAEPRASHADATLQLVRAASHKLLLTLGDDYMRAHWGRLEREGRASVLLARLGSYLEFHLGSDPQLAVFVNGMSELVHYTQSGVCSPQKIYQITTSAGMIARLLNGGASERLIDEALDLALHGDTGTNHRTERTQRRVRPTPG